MFVNNALRIIDSNCNFHEMCQEEASRFVLNEEIKEVIVSKEVIVATNESFKDGNMAGVQKIEDENECVSISNSVCSRNWRKNTSLATEEKIGLNLVETVVQNIIGYDEGKIKAREDCYKVW